MVGCWFWRGDTVLARGNWAGLGWAGVCGAGEVKVEVEVRARAR